MVGLQKVQPLSNKEANVMKRTILAGVLLVIALIIGFEIIDVVCKAILWILANFAGPIIWIAIVAFIAYVVFVRDYDSKDSNKVVKK